MENRNTYDKPVSLRNIVPLRGGKRMVAGHLQVKKNYYYMVLNLKDEYGKRKTKWLPTGIPATGKRNEKKALDIQDWLGHSDYSTTANIYAHLDTGTKKISAETMSQVLTISPDFCSMAL